MESLEQFFNDNDRGYPRDPRRMAYAKLKKNIQGMDREQLEAFIKANLFIPHSQYKMALGNLIQFLNKQDQMNQLNEVKRFQKLAGVLKEAEESSSGDRIKRDMINTMYEEMKRLNIPKQNKYVEDFVDNQLSPKIYDLLQILRATIGKEEADHFLGYQLLDIVDKKLDLDLTGEVGENWHPDDPASADIDDAEEDFEDFDDISETEGEGTDYDESSDSESDDTDAMGGINEAEPQKKGTLDQKEKIVEKLQYAIEDYLEDLGLKELSDEEKPKFQKGLGFTQTTPSDAFINKTRTGFHVTASDDDPRRSDPRHNDQQVTYGLRIYKPNEKFNISTLRGFIQQAKREAKAEGFRFSDTVRRSNQDILCSVTVR